MRKLSAIFSNFNMPTKINLMIAFSIIVMLFLAIISLAQTQNTLMREKGTMIKQNVEMVDNIVGQYYAKQQSGILTEEQAEAGAKEAIQKLRYDGNNYFWIMDAKAKIVLHPLKSELNNTDGNIIKDPKGKYLFTEMAKEVAKNGSGYVKYEWSKPTADPKKTYAKMAYVQDLKKWNWVVGTGIYIDDVNREIFKSFSRIAVGIFFTMIVFGFIAYLFSLDTVGAVQSIIINLETLSAGKKCEGLPVNRRDEFGNMAKNIADADEKLFAARKSEALRLESAQNEIKKKETLEKLILEFEARSGTILTSVNTAADDMFVTFDNMSSLAEDVKDRANSVARASTETSENVQMVASATEEMSSSVQEISTQTQIFTDTMGNSIEQMQKADHTSILLNSATTKIDEITGVIQSIAGQINMLALNATIESARAGEAGRGFAVVANEVKQLADQTEKATVEISQHILNIKDASSQVIETIGQIKATIESVDGISGSISSAVEEQSAVTREIAQNMANASTGTSAIDNHIKEVSQFSADVADAASQTEKSAHNMVDQTKVLGAEINKFLQAVRAA
jgi:methyl-accepting chemotaxis protein